MHTPEPDQTKAAPSPTRQIQFTAQSRRAHVTAFENSNQTMTGYCLQNGLLLPTFSGWVARYGRKKQAAFVPIKIQTHSESKENNVIKKPFQKIEIHRGDVKVILPENNDLKIVIELIKAVMSCN